MTTTAVDHVIGSAAVYTGSKRSAHGGGWTVYPCGPTCGRCMQAWAEGDTRLRYILVRTNGTDSVDRLSHVRPESFTTAPVDWPSHATPVEIQGYRYMLAHLRPHPGDVTTMTVYFHTAAGTVEHTLLRARPEIVHPMGY